MPRVCLTQEQRERDAVNQIREALADGIAIQKARNRLTNRQVAGGLDVGERTIANLLHQEDVKLTVSQTIRLLRFAGLTVAKK